MKRLCLFLAVIVVVLASASLVSAATSWYLPEGSTDNFDLWVLVTNPNATDAEVTFTFYRSDLAAVTQTATVAANNRYSLNVNSVSGIGNSAVSTKVQCTNRLNIYAERAMYWSTSNFPTWEGGHTARGISGLEGCYTEIEQPASAYDADTLILIDTAGSYKLIGNIDCSSLTDTNAIEITASNVTLDLNGFTVTGPGNSGDEGNGIYAYGEAATPIYNVTVMNGGVTSFRKRGIYFLYCTGFYIIYINTYQNGRYGITCWTGALAGTIENCRAANNGAWETDTAGGGIYINNSTILQNCVSYNSTGYGIVVLDHNNIIRNNTSSSTQQFNATLGEAIYVYGSRNIVADNVCNDSSYGIRIAGDGNRLDGNHCMGNTDTQDVVIIAGGDNNLVVNSSFDSAVADAGAGNQIAVDNLNDYNNPVL